MERVGDIVKARADMPCEFIVAASGASVVRQRDQDYRTGVRDIHVTDTVARVAIIVTYMAMIAAFVFAMSNRNRKDGDGKA